VVRGRAAGQRLQLTDRTNVVVFNTLSKRSSMPGYRSGFAAGDPEIVAALKRYRPNVGVAPQTFIQRAAAARGPTRSTSTEVRERYRAKRDALLPALLAAGLEPSGGDASFFLWLRVPERRGRRGLRAAPARAARHRRSPRAVFGPGGEGTSASRSSRPSRTAAARPSA
jgi:acetylornithine aminotransferase